MIVEKYHKNTIVTECDAMIVGFLAYMVPNDYLSYTGEVRSINILKSHQKIEIEKTLIYEGIRRLNRFSNITVWVLHNNGLAIQFYEH